MAYPPDPHKVVLADDRDEIIVSGETYRVLERIARSLDCTVNAALEEVVREYEVPS